MVYDILYQSFFSFIIPLRCETRWFFLIFLSEVVKF